MSYLEQIHRANLAFARVRSVTGDRPAAGPMTQPQAARLRAHTRGALRDIGEIAAPDKGDAKQVDQHRKLTGLVAQLRRVAIQAGNPLLPGYQPHPALRIRVLRILNDA